MKVLRSSILFVISLSSLTIASENTTPSEKYKPKSNIGVPAGLIPHCPGMLKNATISPKMMSNLRMALYTFDERGRVVSNAIPVTVTHKAVMRERKFDLRNRKTVIYACGYVDSSTFPTTKAIAAAYIKRGYNVMVTDTITFLTHIYPISARLSRAIGRKIGEMIVRLLKLGLRPENLELTGLSLGSHIVSYAAKHMYKLTGLKPSRITGLDPAGPCFRSLTPEYRLSPTDAHRVDVLHTNIDGFGIAEPLGHVDFYANGGEYQPGDIPLIPCLVICSHLKALLYFWQALEHPKTFIGVQCDSVQDARYSQCYNSSVTNYLGLETRFSKPGIYYLPTNNEFPYMSGKEGLKEENEVYTSNIARINSDDNFIV